MKILQLIKNKFINKKEIADIKTVSEPGGSNGYKPFPHDCSGQYGGYSHEYFEKNKKKLITYPEIPAGSGGTSIPFCGTCGTQCSANYVLNCNCLR